LKVYETVNLSYASLSEELWYYFT